MDKFIDSDKLIWQVQNNDKYGTITKQVFISLLQNSETAEVKPVTHAHWIETEDLAGNHYIECSHCRWDFWLEGENAKQAELFHCPRCGAKMDEVN